MSEDLNKITNDDSQERQDTNKVKLEVLTSFAKTLLVEIMELEEGKLYFPDEFQNIVRKHYLRKKADELNITMTAVIKLCIGKFIDNIDNEEDLLK